MLRGTAGTPEARDVRWLLRIGLAACLVSTCSSDNSAYELTVDVPNAKQCLARPFVAVIRAREGAMVATPGDEVEVTLGSTLVFPDGQRGPVTVGALTSAEGLNVRAVCLGQGASQIDVRAGDGAAGTVAVQCENCCSGGDACDAGEDCPSGVCDFATCTCAAVSGGPATGGSAGGTGSMPGGGAGGDVSGGAGGGGGQGGMAGQGGQPNVGGQAGQAGMAGQGGQGGSPVSPDAGASPDGGGAMM